MADADLQARFKKAVWLIRNGPKIESTSNEKKLEFYSYYKQVLPGCYRQTRRSPNTPNVLLLLALTVPTRESIQWHRPDCCRARKSLMRTSAEVVPKTKALGATALNSAKQSQVERLERARWSREEQRPREIVGASSANMS